MKNTKIAFRSLVIILIMGVMAACTAKPTPVPTAGPVSPTQSNLTSSENPSANPEITIKSFAYTPSTLTIKVGTTVKWTNQDSVAHTVSSDSGLFDSGELSTGDTYSFTFSQAGTYGYHCTFHPSMIATIIVSE